MKNIHFIAFLFILSNGLDAQTVIVGSAKENNLHRHSLPHHTSSTCAYDSTVNYSHYIPPNWQFKTCSYYNSNGYEINDLDLVWNGSAWTYWSRDTIAYNTSNDKTSEVSQIWDSTAKAWVNGGQNIFMYNSNNDLISEVNQQWKGSTWVNQELYSYAYNSSNDQITSLYQTWDTTTLAWINSIGSSRDTMIYNSSNDLISDTWQQWSSSTWDTSYKYVYLYNTHNKIVTDTMLIWTGTAWQNSALITYTYNSSEDMLSYRYQSWKYLDSAWINSDSVSYVYNANNTNTGYQDFDWDAFDSIWNKNIKGNSILCSNNTCYAMAQDSGFVDSYYMLINSGWGSWQTDSILFYGCTITGISPIISNTADITIYPNPAMNTLNIEISDNIEKVAEIKIIDVTGKTISAYSSKTGNLISGGYGWTIDTSKLAAAMYFVEVMTDKETKVMKFIKQ